jgi:hypothetical protein
MQIFSTLLFVTAIPINASKRHLTGGMALAFQQRRDAQTGTL